MKKIIAVTLTLLLMLTLAGCSKDEPATIDEPAATATESETTTEDPSAVEESEETSSAETEDADDASDVEEPEESSDSDSGLLSPEFKQTMDDYEAWFDHYCEVMQKYKENPSDLELLTEMTDLLSEETVMLDEMEKMDQSEMNAAELAYYLEVTARIEKKLLEVAY